MTNKNKQKGKYFENKIAKSIRGAFNLKPHECRRADESGNGAFEYGDIFFTDFEKYSIVIEAKFHESWSFQGLFPRLNKIFLDWYEELNQAVKKYKIYYKSEPYFDGLVFSKAYHDLYVISSKLLPLSKISYTQKYLIDGIEQFLYVYNLDEVLEHINNQINKDS